MSNKGAQYHCDYCRKDISNLVHIRCAECKDFDLCLGCFSVGVEVYPHRNHHNYRVIDHVTTPIFDEEWGADEELLLLEAIEMYGLGNWSDVCDHVGTKTKQKCEQHYYQVYLNSATAPLPDLAAPLRTKAAASQAMEQTPSPTELATKYAVDKKTKGGLASVVGYTPHRGDFEVEFENEAENVLADMEFKPEDTKVERELKLKVLQIYNKKLDERAARKQFILERGLLESSSKSAAAKKSSDEIEIENSMKVFARFHSKAEHEQFLKGLVHEMSLRKRINQLQAYRQAGIRTLADAELYEQEEAKTGRGGRAYNSKKRSRGASGGSKAGKKMAKGEEPDLDITILDGVELLSAREKELVAELKLSPKQYMEIKARILDEAHQHHFLDPNATRQLVNIHASKTDKIIDFFVSVGWARLNK